MTGSSAPPSYGTSQWPDAALSQATINNVCIDDNTPQDSVPVQPSRLAALAAGARARWPAARQFIIDNYLVLAFAVAVIFAMAFPLPGERVVAVAAFLDIRTIQVRSLLQHDTNWGRGM